MYTINHADSNSDTPGTISFCAESDDQALEKVRKLVRDGFRGQSWANIKLQDGRSYVARNVSGRVVAKFI
jgi:hypothetical protein